MAVQTRLGQIGFGHRPYAAWVAKTEFILPRVGITRLGQQAIGVRPYLGFVAKAEAAVVAGGRILRNNPMAVTLGKMMNR